MNLFLLLAPGQNVIYAHVIIQNFESKTLICTQIGFSFLLGVFVASRIEDFGACFEVTVITDHLLRSILFDFVDGTTCCFLGRFNEIILKESFVGDVVRRSNF